MPSKKYAEKDRTIAIILAISFGLFGIHRFYLGDTKKGALYLLFCWTGIPGIIGWYDAFKYFTNDSEFGVSYENEASTSAGKNGSVNTTESQPTEIEIPNGAINVVEGANGRLTLYEDRLEISREDIGMVHKLQHGFKGDKEIPLESITSIQLRKPSSVTRGYIQFGQAGFSESDDGLMDATSDENTVLFDKESLAEFEELRSKVRDMKQGNVDSSTGSIDDAIEKLRERYVQGEIDEEEYEKRKEFLEKE